MGDTLSWLERRPLHGQVVAVTRARAQASGLAERLAEPGRRGRGDARRSGSCRGVDDPDVTEAISRIREYALVCFTSPNGVRLLFDALEAAGHDARAFAGATVAAIGPGTAAELERRGIARGRGAGALGRRGAGRGAGGRAGGGAGRARGARRGRPRRAHRRALEPGRARERRGRCTTRWASRSGTRSGSARARHLRDLHLQLDRPLLPRGRRAGAGRGAHGLDRPGDQRHGARSWA